MALQVDLMGNGMATELAILEGMSQPVTIAGVGTAQSGGAAITASQVLGTTAGGSTAFVAPSNGVLNKFLLFTNTSSTAALLYPPVGGYFNTGAVNTSISVAQYDSVLYMRISSTRWVAIQTASPSILAGTNSWTGAQTFTAESTFTGQAIFRGAVPPIIYKQNAATAKTVSATLTAAEVLAGIITVNQGGAGASALQLPTGTALETAMPATIANGDSFDFSVINISTVAAEAASLTTNTNWTLVGDMDIIANSASTTKSSGLFRARRTAANTWTLYRIS